MSKEQKKEIKSYQAKGTKKELALQKNKNKIKKYQKLY
jgi:hypothetical protein